MTPSGRSFLVTLALAACSLLVSDDTAHAIWSLIGDINQVSGGMKTIARANKAAAQVIQDASK